MIMTYVIRNRLKNNHKRVLEATIKAPTESIAKAIALGATITHFGVENSADCDKYIEQLVIDWYQWKDSDLDFGETTYELQCLLTFYRNFECTDTDILSYYQVLSNRATNFIEALTYSQTEHE